MSARQALDDALNGDRDQIDRATRRGLVALANEVDDLRDSIATLQRRVTQVGGAVSTTFLAAAAALFSRLG